MCVFVYQMVWFAKLITRFFEHVCFDRIDDPKEIVIHSNPMQLSIETEPDVVWEDNKNDNNDDHKRVQNSSPARPPPVSTSPCTVVCTVDLPVLQTNHLPHFGHHSEICTHLLTRFDLLQGLVNHDLFANGWKGDIGSVFDPIGVLSTAFQTLFTIFQHINVGRMDAMHERACICACLTTSMKFLRRSAMLSVPTWSADNNPMNVKLGHVYVALFQRGSFTEETMHTLVERWEAAILTSQINVFWCAMANAATIAEFELERWLSLETGKSDVAGDERIYLLRNISTLLFLSLHVSGSDLLDLAKSDNLNAMLGRSLAMGARAIEAPESFAFEECDVVEATTAAAVISGLIDSPQCESMLAKGRCAPGIGVVLSNENLRRSIEKLDGPYS